MKKICDKCIGSGIMDYFDHGTVQHGEEALEPIKCSDCDGFGNVQEEIYILWQAWDVWQIHSLYLWERDAINNMKALKASKGPEKFMDYKIEKKVVL
nr:MAG TPA: Transcription attenuation protein [Caudoviricetes sp.]